MAEIPLFPPTSRREFLRQASAGISLISFSQVAPAFLTQSVRAAPPPEKDRSVLVLIQLAGGNDGLNTVVPYEDDHYYRLRPKLGVAKKDLNILSDQFGLHAECGEMAALFKEGKLGIVQNVGYPNPNRSHFRSMEIWESASDSERYESTGWLGRYFDHACSGADKEMPLAMNLGDEMPDAFISESDHNLFSLTRSSKGGNRMGETLLEALRSEEQRPEMEGNLGFLQHTLMNTLVAEREVLKRIRNYKSMAAYPDFPLAKKLQQVAGLVASGQATRVYFVSLSGFDTHANQADSHSRLLKQLSGSMAAFQADLAAHKLEDQVLTMTFSEFGRRPNENSTRGTDHGTSAPLFVMGNQLKGSVFGSAPDLDLKDGRDMAYSTDFRSVYATVLDRWMETDSKAILGRRFDPLKFL